MGKYQIGINHARQRRFLYKSKKFIIVVGSLLALVILVIFVDNFLQKRKAEIPSKPTQPISSTVSPSIEIFTSQYFQFQTNKKWRFIANESTGTKFTYRRGTDNLVSVDMTVYINSAPSDLQATRVLPVVFDENTKSLKASFVSEHCRKNLSKDIQDRQGEASISLNSVKFLCDVDGTNFTAIVGQENGTPVMNYLHSDGTPVSYLVYFRDLRSTPDPNELRDIMNSFQIR